MPHRQFTPEPDDSGKAFFCWSDEICGVVMRCPDCEGRGEYRYLHDPKMSKDPLCSLVCTGHHDGWWWKRCTTCDGEGYVASTQLFPGHVDLLNEMVGA